MGILVGLLSPVCCHEITMGILRGIRNHVFVISLVRCNDITVGILR